MMRGGVKPREHRKNKTKGKQNEAVSSQISSGGGLPPSSALEIKLTPQGLALVGAWLEGKESQHAKASKSDSTC
jgi:hypothetical protein